MSQERVLKTLEGLGLENRDAKVYIFLAKNGPKKAGDITKALKLPKQRLYVTLKTLQNQGLVSATLQRPAKFSAIQFEKALDLFVEAKMEEAQRIQQNRNEILSDWRSINLFEVTDQSPKFSVLQGKNFIFPRVKQMIQETKHHLSLILSVPTLYRAYQSGLIDSALEKSFKQKAEVRYLTELTKENIKVLKDVLHQIEKKNIPYEARVPTLGFNAVSQIIIRDDEEAVFFINSSGIKNGLGKEDSCLWTNCKPIVQSFTTIFEQLWFNSTEIDRKIAEIETGNISPKTCLIPDPKTAIRLYEEILHGAQKEVIMLTSCSELLAFSKNETLLNEWSKRGVVTKAMFSIDNTNFEAANRLMKHFEVKHVPSVNLGVTIIDDQHYFQFKIPAPEKPSKTVSNANFRDAFYTNDKDYAKEIKKMLITIWDTAQFPSPISLKNTMKCSLTKSITSNSNMVDEYDKVMGFRYIIEPQQNRIKEIDVTKKISSAVRIRVKDPQRDILQIYGAMGSAIIYSPKSLNLPVFIIQVYKNNNKSAFGAENSLIFFVQTTIANQSSYLPAVFITDNLQGFKFRNAMHRNYSTTEMTYLLKKDELEIQANGNNLFAAWTVPIKLLPPKYILPPSCIRFEGYGKVKSYSSEIHGPMGRKIKYEYNSLDAFVTFMHPTLKYSGPGSDGILHRDMIMSSYPSTPTAESTAS